MGISGPPSLRERTTALLLGVLCVAIGLAARTWLDGWWAKHLGVVLWCWVVYALVLVVSPRLSPTRSGAWALAFSWAVEFFQLTPIPGRLARQSVWLRWVFGETFSRWDLLGAFVAIVLATMLHALALRMLIRRPAATLGA